MGAVKRGSHVAFSPATKTLLGEAASWVAAASLGAVALTHFDELGACLSRALGVPAPAASGEAVAVAEEHAAAPAEARAGGIIEIPAGDNGHYHAEAEINGRPIRVLVDTGATMVALTHQDAEAVGIYLRPADFTRAISTANGIARVAPVSLDRVSIGDITVRNVRATVSEPGRLETSLLGMSFLGRLARVDIRSGVLFLQD